MSVVRSAQGEYGEDVGRAAIKYSRTVNYLGDSTGLGIYFAELVHFAPIGALILFNGFFMK